MEEWEIDVKHSQNIPGRCVRQSQQSRTTLLRCLRRPEQLRHGGTETTPNAHQLVRQRPQKNDRDAAPDAFNCATNDPANGKTIGNVVFNFGSLVLDVFTDIFEDTDAGNSDAVANLLSIVKSYSCYNFLPDLDIIWLDSASSGHLQVEIEGVTSGVATKAARPAACSAFDCNTLLGPLVSDALRFALWRAGDELRGRRKGV